MSDKFVKDKNNIYFWTTRNYAGDCNIPILEKIEEADYETFEILEDSSEFETFEGKYYAKDKNNIYYLKVKW
ncbi:MAG: DKNYY domain-containing protein [Candidatus Peribacteria bacterium]|jgi:hypothetical protein|nr:DKNYY domain-containing protein [Candidatus Peribacteria bacterium]